jgi:hypothetical protein
MRTWSPLGRLSGSAPAVLIVAFLLAGVTNAGQVPASQTPFPRTADGKPDLNGIWHVIGTANWDLEGHEAQPSPVLALGAVGAVPAGLGVVEGGRIPYQPWAAAKKKENAKNWLTLDPEVKCFLPGVPRATYLPHPFQIFQSPGRLLIVYGYSYARREINMLPRGRGPADFWMGWSDGRWEGDTLILDVTSFNDQSWFDRAGNFHSDALHVVERYTPITPYHIAYEATIEDSKVFTRPWKISMPLYRVVDKNAQLLEFKCVELTEKLLYGDLVKEPKK